VAARPVQTYDVLADHNGPHECFGGRAVCGEHPSPGLAGTVGFSLPPGDDVPNSFVATQFGHQRYAFIT
jgi:hypothetical protein